MAGPDFAPRSPADRSLGAPRTTLDEAVLHKTQAVVLLPPCPTPLPARFERAGPDTVTLLLYTAPPPLGEDTVACVQHTVGRRDVAFLAEVTALERRPAGAFVTVRRPGGVARVEQRRAFRFPVRRGHIEAVVSFGPNVLQGGIVDLSRFGAQVTLAPADIALVVGQRVVLSMRRPGVRVEDEVVVHARVVRRTATGGGLAFVPGPDGTPTPELLGLVHEAELAWRARRGAA